MTRKFAFKDAACLPGVRLLKAGGVFLFAGDNVVIAVVPVYLAQKLLKMNNFQKFYNSQGLGRRFAIKKYNDEAIFC
ncbi:MAG: hypothetical protein KDK39_00710 [Leptospiraceae bacterium]|nr:hypothetical protein [Leptospiraceae bacterium]